MALVCTSIGCLHVTVQSEAEISAEEWKSWLTQITRAGDDRLRLLIESHGGAPNAAQRREFVEKVRYADTRIAVVTDSALARGVVTALAWLGQPLRAFTLGELAQALDYLALTRDEAESARRELMRLRQLQGRGR